MKSRIRVALVGNPNTGKSTVFNGLTGLNQKIGNFPGVTIDKKTGFTTLPDQTQAEIIDLPGIYSLYPKSRDESIAFEILCDKRNNFYPDLAIVIADASNLKRNLLLFTQVADLGIPVILVLNMMDEAKKLGIEIDVEKLSQKLGVTIVPMNARNNEGLKELKLAISNANQVATQYKTIDVEFLAPTLIEDIQTEFKVETPYEALQIAHQYKNLKYFQNGLSSKIESINERNDFKSERVQSAETILRYQFIHQLLLDCVTENQAPSGESFSNKIDQVLTHKFWGLTIFISILFVLFQSIFSLASYPMDFIETSFLWLGDWLNASLPEGVFRSLLVEGILAGLGGVIIFVPQIMILFAFIAILEDTGYMARVTFMMDKLMRKVGLNGKSVVPLISGVACAVPAIMATRTIENWKDRLITILVTPLMSCSARLPVYTLLIALVVPDERIFGILNLQGLTLLAMYLIGFFAAIGAALVMKWIVKSREKGYFIMELPVYRMPRWSNVGISMYDRAKTFVLEAGKVIIAVSIILWVLASYGPAKNMQAVEDKFADTSVFMDMDEETIQSLYQSEKLEASYAGILGKFIEPVIEPLGFDWKIGIALITSFAAREVFVGTMATIYSTGGGDEDLVPIREKMREATNPQTGEKIFTLATALSLMIFYAFAMQCVSTLAVVLRETKSIKWPLIQFAYMTALAYLSSLLVFQFFK